jgi:hypothetical protein
MMAVLMILSLPLADDVDPNSCYNRHLGLMMMLSSLDKAKHDQMTGLIVVFFWFSLGFCTFYVVLGCTIGSIILLV